MIKILLIGKSAQLHCIAETLARSPQPKKLYTMFSCNNPGLRDLSNILEIGHPEDIGHVRTFAKCIKPHFAIIGPEEPLAKGVVDVLRKIDVPCVGPLKSLARIEWSKAFCRTRLDKYGIQGNPEYRIFYHPAGIASYTNNMDSFVIKPDGLTAGKGVKIFPDDFSSREEALAYCQMLLAVPQGGLLIEEKLDGEEFSIQAFCDGRHVIFMPAAQDHKRALDNDFGLMTGGMGSYSCPNHSLPFLAQDDMLRAYEITTAVMHALRAECGAEYKGILYGGFIRTAKGVYLLEFNARFADPEAMNVLPLLETDFIKICEAMIQGTLHLLPVTFRNLATVCKYVVPKGYPLNPLKNMPITFKEMPAPADANRKLYYGGIEARSDELYLTGSRALACVGISHTLAEAERIAEDMANRVEGLVYHRRDIGTAALIERRIAHLQSLCKIT